MTYILIVLLCGINAAPLLFPQLDIWHAQGIWTQIFILILFSSTFFKRPQFTEPTNIELGLLHLWVGLQTALICFAAQTHGKYDITHFFPYFNFLCLVMLYKIIVQYMNKPSLELCLVFFKYAIIANLLICVLQYFGLSQVFKMFYPSDVFHNNPVVGFIGNGTHLSGFLAMSVPVFLYFGKREDYLCLGLMGILLCLAGTSTGDPSISGWIVGSVAIAFYFLNGKRINLLQVSIFAVVIVTVLLILSNHSNFLSFNGRIGVWEYYLPVIKQWFLTGTGLGTMNAIYKQSTLPEMRHMHMEYLQFVLEIGFIGFLLIGAFVKRFLEIKPQDSLSLCFKSIFVAFLVSACFNYPAHLWLTATYACFSYSSFIALNRG